MTKGGSSWRRSDMRGLVGDALQAGWEQVTRLGAIKPGSRRAARFGAFGAKSVICFPVAALFGERYIRIGEGSVVGPFSTLSAGVEPDQVLDHSPVIRIGDRCVIGKGSAIVGHAGVEIGDDVWTGPHVYITDANHGYEDVTMPIGVQFAANEPVRIGAGSWLGTGVVVLPGTTIGRHVVVGAGAVVADDLPDNTVAVGNPARVVRRFAGGEWAPVADDGHPPTPSSR
jgi:acetyltransferase-like isoleucine patch superfamily enzyme